MTLIEPIQPKLRIEALDAGQLDAIKSGTLQVLEEVGVHFPSERALRVFADHGARVDWAQQVVRMSPELVTGAMAQAPRSYLLAGRGEGRGVSALEVQLNIATPGD